MNMPGGTSRILGGKRPDLLAEFIRSSATLETPISSLTLFWSWWEDLHGKYDFAVERIAFKDLERWSFDPNGALVHDSGRFFGVRGVDVRTNYGAKPAWSQPIIVQPEIGILGIVCQRRHGILHFLMQAKMEPGNLNKLQLSPTVQATRSNYSQVHGGELPPYLEFFTNLDPKRVVVDQLQSEQGARFYRKRNRNIILQLPDTQDISVRENFIWLTLGQIRELLRDDDVVNMNTRSVLASFQPGRDRRSAKSFDALRATIVSPTWTDFEDALLASLMPGNSYTTSHEIISWFTALKAHYDLDVSYGRLDALEGWRIGPDAISHVEGKYFDVIAVRARMAQREVTSWSQPMIQQREPGIVGFLIRRIRDRYHLLVQAKMEVGNFDVLEMAPTVQCLTGSYTSPEFPVPFLDLFMSERGNVRYDTMLSEEGGRFFRESNRYMVLEVGADVPLEVPPRYMWMTLRQAKDFIKYNNYFNVEARSLLSCISPL